MVASTRTLARLIAALSISLAGSSAVAVSATGTAFAASAARASSASSGDTWTGQGDGEKWTDGANWSSGVPQDGDSVTIAPTGTQASPHVIDMPGGTQLQDLTLDDASLDGGDATLAGDFTWSASTGTKTLDASLTVEGSATLSGAGTMASLEPIAFEGDTEISSALETEDVGNAITNTGTFTIDPGATVQADECCASLQKFVNSGTLRVSAGGDGTLSLMDLVDHGSISVVPGSQLLVTRGEAAFDPGVGITGGGTVTFEQGTAAKLANHLAIGTGTTVELTGNASFTGTGGVTGNGEFLWTGGTIFANMDVATKTAISGTAFKSLASPNGKRIALTLHGATTLSGSGVLGISQANITNAGTFTMDPGTAIHAGACCVSPDKFTNTGKLSMPTAGVANVTFADFDDRGTVSVAKGAVLDVATGPGDLTGGKSISGGGTLEFDQNAAISVGKQVSIGAKTTVQLNGGASFSGTGGFVGTGLLLWTGGSIEGTIDVAVPTVISGASTKNLASETSKLNTLTLEGTTSFTGPGALDLSGNVTLDNEGTMTAGPGTTVSAGGCCVHPDHVVNGGTFVVAATVKSPMSLSFLAFVNRGTVKLASGKLVVTALSYDQKAGTTNLAGGSLSSSLPVKIDGGTLTGHGVVAASVTSSGTVLVRPASVLTITGSYGQTKSGTFATTVTGSSFGQLVVSGAATLAGTIKVNASKLGKVKTFKVIKFHSHTGKFTTVSGTPRYKVSYSGAVQIKY